MRAWLVFAMLAFVGPASWAVDTLNGVFDPRFATLSVSADGHMSSLPVVGLASQSPQVTVGFDEFGDEASYLRYRLLHCNADWQPSGLTDSEMMSVFNDMPVTDFSYSESTAVHYVHYSVTVPNDDVRFRVSGNYLLQVVDESQPDSVLLQARFVVSENTAGVSASVTSRTDIDYNERHHQLAIDIDCRNCDIDDLYRDLIVVIGQNGRIDNSVSLTSPSRVSGSRAIYEHMRPLIFEAGNEYRRMETVSVHYPGMHVDDIGYVDPCYHMQLAPDYPRAGQPYQYDSTQHGRFLVSAVGSTRSDVQADYVMTHFTLVMPPMPASAVYLDGDFTCRRFSPSALMHYDHQSQCYRASMMLKQGAYNYQYLAVPQGSSVGHAGAVEGNHYPTVNVYTVMVYRHTPLGRYDRLLGTATIYSDK